MKQRIIGLRRQVGRRTNRFAVLLTIAASISGCGTDARLDGFQFKSVRSSALDTIEYYDGQQALYVEFDNGSEYIFYAVPRSIYDDMQESPSKGKFFHNKIRGRFKYERLE